MRIDDSTRVAEARRVAISGANAEGLDETAAEQVAIIATEMATNLLKHAVSGEVHIKNLSHSGRTGIELLSIDRGPGMANLRACVADGFSTAGTPGNGLGAISRLASVFDAHSEPGRGTVVLARKYRSAPAANHAAWVFGAVRVPYPGEEACGDNWSLRSSGPAASVIVADGLGHGLLAADASGAAMAAFQKAPPDSPVAVLRDVHQALRHTRGAAVAVSFIEHEKRQLRYAGVGNIVGVLLGNGRPQYMVSHHGTAGMEVPRLQEFQYALPEDAVVVMHSDGLTTSWSLDSYPGILRRHPSIIAGVLYRDAARGHDDACVVVGRWFHE